MTQSGIEFDSISATPSQATCTVVCHSSADCVVAVAYGPDTNYGTQTPYEAVPTTDHSVTISGLTPSTNYHYKVVDDQGNASGDQQFRTADPVQPQPGEDLYDVRQLQLNADAIWGVPTFVAVGATDAAKLEGLVSKSQMHEAIVQYLGVADTQVAATRFTARS